MAPITRSSRQENASLLKEGSWEFANNEQLEQDSESVDGESEELSEDDPRAFGMPSPSRSTSQEVSQLQSTADRVTRQAEEFAKCLDKFVISRSNSNSGDTWRDAHSAVKTFGKKAKDRADALTKSGSSRSPSKGRNGRSLSSSRNREEAQQCRLEEELWELLSETIQLQSPRNQVDLAARQTKAFHGLNRYSSDSERWGAFLHTDGYAQEAVAVLSWLQRTADQAGPPIEALTEDLRYRSERGDGIWASGWLYTKETIKGQKRFYEWPHYVDPKEHPKIRVSRKTDGVNLVTQLDPDATLRQARQRCEEDDFHEAANWVACWELLRRGKSWSYIRDHWAERHEEWHSASILGDSPLDDVTNTDAGLTWMKAYGSGRMWSLTCRALSQENGIDPYEAAVYALLSSDIDRSMRVCQTVDDYLFSLLSGLVLERYDRFCRALEVKLQDPLARASNSYQSTAATESYERIRLLMRNLALSKKTRQQTLEPLKMMQAAIISKDYNNFFASQGKAIAKVYHTGNRRDPFSDDAKFVPQQAATDTTKSPESMMVHVHVQLILQKLGYFHGDESQAKYLDNNIVSYMLWLQKKGKLEAIPLYASCLSPDTAASALGQILINVTAKEERDLIAGLLQKYGISLPDILAVMFEQLWPEYSSEIKISQFRQVAITEYSNPQHPRQLKVRTGILAEEIMDEEQNLIHCLEWHHWVSADAWDQCCSIATRLLKRFILQGRLSAAWTLFHRASLARLSAQILQVDLRENETPTDTPESESPLKPSSKSHSKRMDKLPVDITDVKHESHTWRELEELVYALSAFESWAEVAEQTEKHRNDPSSMRKCKAELGERLAEVEAGANYYTSPEWLRLPLTTEEAPLLHTIRTFYLPEMLLAQTSVLYFAGHYLSRDHLAECMEVAVTIASTEGLAETVQEANRMREMMNQLASVSKSLLLANEHSSKKKVKEGTALNVSIWQVKPDEVGLEKEMGRAK